MRAIVCFLQQIWQFRMWQQWIAGHSHQRISICACSGLCALFFDALTRPERGNLLQSILLISQVFPSQSSQWDWDLCQSWVLTSWWRGFVTTVEPTQLLSADIRAFFLPLAPFPRPCFRPPKATAIGFHKCCAFSPPCSALVFNQSVNKRGEGTDIRWCSHLYYSEVICYYRKSPQQRQHVLTLCSLCTSKWMMPRAARAKIIDLTIALHALLRNYNYIEYWPTVLTLLT